MNCQSNGVNEEVQVAIFVREKLLENQGIHL